MKGIGGFDYICLTGGCPNLVPADEHGSVIGGGVKILDNGVFHGKVYCDSCWHPDTLGVHQSVAPRSAGAPGAAKTATIWPGAGALDLDAIQRALSGAGEPEALAVPTEQEVVEACVETWRGGDWQGWLKRMEKRGLVVRKIKGAA